MNGLIQDQAVNTVPFLEGVLSGDGLKEVRITPWGHVESTRGHFVIDDEGGGELVRNFQKHATPLVIDWEHQTLGGEYASPDGRATVAGWVHKLWINRGKGIFGLIEWNPKTRESIQQGEYRFLSPVLTIRKSDGRAVGLHSIGLTNKPAIRGMDALAAKEKIPEQQTIVENQLQANVEGGGTVDELLRRIKEALGLEGERSAEDILQLALQALGGNVGDKRDTEVASSVRETLGLASDAGANEVTLALATRANENAEVMAMREAEADRLAKELVDKYVQANVLNPNDKAAMEAAMSLARERPDRLRAMLDSATPYVPPGRTIPPTRRQNLIAKAVNDWKNDEAMQKTCGCEAAISLALRDAGLEKLSDEETRAYVTR